MASFLYSAYNAALHLLPIKRMLGKEGAAFDRMVKKFETRQTVKKPSSRLMRVYHYRKEIAGGQPCYIACSNTKADKAVLLLFGGGYILPPDQGDFSFAGKMAACTGADVYLPMYPLAPKYQLIDTMKSVTDVYREMLRHYEASKIAFIGNSSGAAFCLSLCLFIRHEKLALPFPRRLIMLSPGFEMPPNEAQTKRMAEQEKKDAMIPVSFCKNIHRVLVNEDSAYLLHTFDASWEGLPEMDIYYGDCELFYAYIPDIEHAAETGKANVHIHVGKGMMHCWPLLGFTREGKATQAEIFRIIKSL